MSDATFNEMASALHELGFSEQEMANAEITARNLVRAGWTQASADMAVIRMRRRNEVLAEIEQMIRRAQHREALVHALMVESPAPWRKIAELSWALVVMKWRSVRG